MVEIDVSVCSLLAMTRSLALGGAGALALTGCWGHASTDDCASMIDHYVDLAVRESPGGAKMAPGQVAAVREVEKGLKRAEPSYRRVEDHCTLVKRSEVRCALGATTTAEWEACLATTHADSGE
jgi:hypothetical protein